MGLEEAQELVALLGRVLWDGMPELLLVVHVYNMLVQRTYLTSSPSYLRKRVEGESVHDVRRKLRPDFGLPKDPLRGQTVWDLLDSRAPKVFKTDPLIVAARRAGWNPERIAPESFDFPSFIGWDVLRRTERVRDPTTGEERFEDTAFMAQVRARSAAAAGGLDEVALVAAVRRYNTPFRSRNSGDVGLRAITDGHDAVPLPSAGGDAPEEVLPGQLPPWPLPEYLDLLRVDFNNDVCGAPYPCSGINYLSAAGPMLQVVEGIDAALAHARHSIRIAATPPG